MPLASKLGELQELLINKRYSYLSQQADKSTPAYGHFITRHGRHIGVLSTFAINTLPECLKGVVDKEKKS